MQCLGHRLHPRQTAQKQGPREIISLIRRYLRFVEFRRNEIRSREQYRLRSCASPTASASRRSERTFTKAYLVPEGVYDPGLLQGLQESGVSLERKSAAEVFAIRGTAVLAAIDPGSGVLRGVETPRVFGFAEAY
jgi:hypothetical protein